MISVLMPPQILPVVVRGMYPPDAVEGRYEDSYRCSFPWPEFPVVKTASKSFAGSARYKARLIGVCLRDGGGFCRSEDGEDCVRL